MPEAKENMIYVWEEPETKWLNNVINYVKRDEKDVIVLYFPGYSLADKNFPFTKYLLDLCHKLNLLPSKRTTVLSYKDHLLALELCIFRIKTAEEKRIAEVGKEEVLKLHEKYVEKYASSDGSYNEEEEETALKSYEEFLTHSNCVTSWKLLDILKNCKEIPSHISGHRYLLLGIPKSDILCQLVEFLFSRKTLRKIVLESPLNASLENSPSTNSSFTIHIDEVLIPVKSLINSSSYVDGKGSATEEYSGELILAFLSLLVNCRNELALSRAMVSPVINLKHAAFTDLKHAANEKEMPMCQMVISYVTKIRLGGKGYAPPVACPLKNYLKEFGQFVDLLNQLQTIIEEDLTRNAVKRVINVTKNKLLRSEHKLRIESIENAAKDLIKTADFLYRHHLNKQETSQIGQKSLDVLYDLVNHSAFSSVILDADAILLQSNSERTPLNLPPLMGYFRSPEEDSEEESQMSIISLKSIKLDEKKEPAPVISYFHHSESNSVSKSCIDEKTPSKTTFTGCLSITNDKIAIKPVLPKERQPLSLINNQNKPNIKRSLLNDMSKPGNKKLKKQPTKVPKGKAQIKGQGQITNFFIQKNI